MPTHNNHTTNTRIGVRGHVLVNDSSLALPPMLSSGESEFMPGRAQDGQPSQLRVTH